LSLQNPEDEAKAKIEKKVPTTMEALSGRWIADSAYTTDDVKATLFTSIDFRMEIFPDSTLHAKDSVRQIFDADFNARLALFDDTLIVNPLQPGRPPDTFYVLIRFAGNWLQLYRPSDYRFLHFHRRKGPDSAVGDTVLPEGLWSLRGRRAAVDTFLPEALRRDFTYLRARPDSLILDERAVGISQVTSGPLSKAGKIWTWTTPGGTRRYLADLVDRDSLRLWPLGAGDRPDSGFSLFAKIPARPAFDLDVTPILGYWRSDTISTPARRWINHFGQYFDFELKADHSVRNPTNMTAFPRFDSWTMDSGRLFLDGTAGRGAFSFERIGDDRLRLMADSGGAFRVPATFLQTRIEGSRLDDHPLERFDRAGYMHVTIGADTLRYYFSANYAPVERFEIAGGDSGGLDWAALQLIPGSESSQSGQEGFFFAFSGTSGPLGRFTCKFLPSVELALRLTPDSDATTAPGQIQGSCHIVAAEHAPSDSTLAVGGFFRFKRKKADQLRSPLWDLP
jgi:hypothetical protein